VEPHDARHVAGRAWAFDPDVVEVSADERYLFYGSYFGGVWARRLSPDGLSTDGGSAVRITISDRYEAPEVIRHDGWYYLFVSATNCCSDPITGYSVFVARSRDPLGPYLDREGVSLLDPRVGGTPVLSMNGNRWIGPGHNTVFEDCGGQWWTAYHAVDRFDAVLDRTLKIRKRPLLLDPLDWDDGWPTVRAGRWASDEPVPVPAAQPGASSRYRAVLAPADEPGPVIAGLADDFEDVELSPMWSWIREPDRSVWSVGGRTLRIRTRDVDLYLERNDASVLWVPAPPGDLLVETAVHLRGLEIGVAPERFVQGGIVFHRGDDDYVKLIEVAMFDTRQTELGKEFSAPDGSGPRYGNTVVGPAGDWSHLRLVRRISGDEELYRAYTSRDGKTWSRGGVWTHQLGQDGVRIGLLAMGGPDVTAVFDRFSVHRALPER
jgi:arabinan endo-1,5-alpha-L-arabinosidase